MMPRFESIRYPVLTSRKLHAAVKLTALLAMFSLVLEFGFYTPPLPVWLLVVVQLVAVGMYVASRAYDLWIAADRAAAMKGLWPDAIVLAAAVLFLLGWAEFSHRHALKVSALYIATIQGALAVRLAIAVVRWNLLFSQSRLHPTRVVVFTFVTLIVVGAIALSLPRAVQPELMDAPDFSLPRHVLNSVFTATSATCVTGLVVYDTGVVYTGFGQVVILLLIQAGGLGIMIFGSAFALLATRRLSMRQSLVLQDALSYRTFGHIRAMVVFIVASTLAIEAIGAALMYPMWRDTGSASLPWFHSLFHSVSAFCNAGFSLQTDSLISFNRSWPVYGCIVPLITLGGLGFPVLHDLWCASKVWLARRRFVGRWRRRSKTVQPVFHRLSLHTKLVLVASVVLIVLPTVLIVAFETFADPAVSSGAQRITMAGASPGGRVLDALFYAVTCRTAGFNTVAMDVESLSSASRFLGCVLMFIGGSPASTAGGVKTVGAVVMVLGVWTVLRGREQVEVMGRTIPDHIVRRASVLVILMFALVSAVTMLLCFTEQIPLRQSLFEAVSACGTVGLSTGLTPDLTAAGRIAIIAAMFAGRLGPLTVLIALAGRSGSARYSYPEEEVSIG